MNCCNGTLALLSSAIAGSLITRSNIQLYHENLKHLNDIKKQFDTQTEEWKNQSNNNKSTLIAQKFQNRDSEWWQDEIRKQTAWKEGPWYKKLLPPPFPNYLGPL